MKKIQTLLFLLVFLGIGLQAQQNNDLQILKKAYPGVFELGNDGNIVFEDGSVIVYDDGIKKDFDEKFANPDLEDMMSLHYPLGKPAAIPELNSDPGRFRTLDFFRKLYGATAEEVSASLEPVIWKTQSSQRVLYFTKKFGVSKRMKAVISELQQLPDKDKFYVSQSGGSFNFRYIAGTQLLSPHSFGIAVDIRVDVSNYWRWEERGAEVYKNRIPWSVVAIFEKYGFIWGGKWYHFDTMHFEYRPEILLKAGAVIADINLSDYSGLSDVNDEN
jgi:peptidoglycan LD-endopeptidase CwlK